MTHDSNNGSHFLKLISTDRLLVNIHVAKKQLIFLCHPSGLKVLRSTLM